MKKLIIEILLIGFFLGGCAGTNVGNIAPHTFSRLSYGDTLEQVESKLGGIGDLIIKSSLHNADYKGFIIAPEHTFTHYLFLYKNNELESISLLEKFRSSFYKNFNGYTILDFGQLESLTKKAIENRINPSGYYFQSVDNNQRILAEQKKKKENAEWLMWAPIIAIAAPVTAPIAAKEYNKDIIQQSHWENISIETSRQRILETFGQPTHMERIDNQEIYFYKRFNEGYRQVGFQKDEVAWTFSDHYIQKK